MSLQKEILLVEKYNRPRFKGKNALSPILSQYHTTLQMETT